MSLQNLADKGWSKQDQVPFNEVVAKKATECYTYINGKNTQLAFLHYPEESLVRLRLAATRGDQFNYFEIKTADTAALIAKLTSVQENADINNYFTFYLDMQSVGQIAILAWEQWESNYR